MAIWTDPAAKIIRGKNPQNLVEKILRAKIYQNIYRKEQYFGLTAETLVDKAMEFDHICGAIDGNRNSLLSCVLLLRCFRFILEEYRRLVYQEWGLQVTIH